MIGLHVSGSCEPPQKGRQVEPKNQSQLLCFEAKEVEEQGNGLHIFFSLPQHQYLQTNFPVPRLLLSSFLPSQPSLIPKEMSYQTPHSLPINLQTSSKLWNWSVLSPHWPHLLPLPASYFMLKTHKAASILVPSLTSAASHPPALLMLIPIQEYLPTYIFHGRHQPSLELSADTTSFRKPLLNFSPNFKVDALSPVLPNSSHCSNYNEMQPSYSCICTLLTHAVSYMSFIFVFLLGSTEASCNWCFWTDLRKLPQTGKVTWGRQQSQFSLTNSFAWSISCPNKPRWELRCL